MPLTPSRQLLTPVMPMQSSDLKIAKQANSTFEALLDVLKIKPDNAADFSLPRTYAEAVMHCMSEAAKFALGSGMRRYTPTLYQGECMPATPIEGLRDAMMKFKIVFPVRICQICCTQPFAAADNMHVSSGLLHRNSFTDCRYPLRCPLEQCQAAENKRVISKRGSDTKCLSFCREISIDCRVFDVILLLQQGVTGECINH